MAESVNPALPSSVPSCFQKAKESKITDALLVISCVGLLIIGILASCGIFEFMGSANAAYLSYGMYAGAAVFALAEIVKLAVNCLQKQADPLDEEVNAQVTNFTIDYTDTDTTDRYNCRIGFTDGIIRDRLVHKEQIGSLVSCIGKEKIETLSAPKNASVKDDFQLRSSIEAKTILEALKKPTANESIKKLTVEYAVGLKVDYSGWRCEIVFEDDSSVTSELCYDDVAALIKEIDRDKVGVHRLEGATGEFNPLTNFNNSHRGGAESIVERLRKPLAPATGGNA